jgi:hypothetical protein
MYLPLQRFMERAICRKCGESLAADRLPGYVRYEVMSVYRAAFLGREPLRHILPQAHEAHPRRF